MSSSNDVIWIFVSFVGFVSIVSGNSLNFFNGYEFNHQDICFKVDYNSISTIISVLLLLNRNESVTL